MREVHSLKVPDLAAKWLEQLSINWKRVLTAMDWMKAQGNHRPKALGDNGHPVKKAPERAEAAR